MQLKFVYDQSASFLPTGLVTALNAIATFFDKLFAADITVTIRVGYGEITTQGETTPVDSSLLAVAIDEDGAFVPYAQVKALLAANPSSSALTSALAALPATDPTNGTGVWLSLAQEKALGLIPANTVEIDGALGIAPIGPGMLWDFTAYNGTSFNMYDFVGTAMHEITHALGRNSAEGEWGQANDYDYPYLLDLFRYVAPGRLGLAERAAAGTAEYLSVDGGATHLADFDTDSECSDFAWPETTDCFDAYGEKGITSPMSAKDFATLSLIGFATRPTSANMVSTSDCNADGRSDVLFRNSAGVAYLWSMNDATIASGATTSIQVGATWSIQAIDDFNGDGTADLLWTYDNAANSGDTLNGVSYISLQNAAAAAGGGLVQQVSSEWRIAGAADFDADGKADVLYRNATTGQTYLDIMNGVAIDWAKSGFTSTQVGLNWSVAAVGDFDGDGKADVLWRYANAGNAADPLNGALYEWSLNGRTVTSGGLLSQQAGANWTVVGSGDFDNDGKADILFRYNNAANIADPLNGMAYIDFLDGTNVRASSAPTQWQVDNSWSVSAIGDYNGDARSDILWRQTATGASYIWEMNGAQVLAGASTSVQVGAEWVVQNGVLIG